MPDMRKTFHAGSESKLQITTVDPTKKKRYTTLLQNSESYFVSGFYHYVGALLKDFVRMPSPPWFALGTPYLHDSKVLLKVDFNIRVPVKRIQPWRPTSSDPPVRRDV